MLLRNLKRVQKLLLTFIVIPEESHRHPTNTDWLFSFFINTICYDDDATILLALSIVADAMYGALIRGHSRMNNERRLEGIVRKRFPILLVDISIIYQHNSKNEMHPLFVCASTIISYYSFSG